MRNPGSLYLPDVETNPKPGVYRDLIAAAGDHGIGYAKIYFVITTCALFNFYNRWITATGVPVMSVEAHRRQGKALASALAAPATPSSR